MGKRNNITQLSMNILIVALLVLSTFSTIFASEKCESMCSIHDHMQKNIKSCCHGNAANLLIRTDYFCSSPDNSVTEMSAVKTQITRSFSQKYLSYSSERNSIITEDLSTFGGLYDYSTILSKSKSAPIYLLVSVSLT